MTNDAATLAGYWRPTVAAENSGPGTEPRLLDDGDGSTGEYFGASGAAREFAKRYARFLRGGDGSTGEYFDASGAAREFAKHYAKLHKLRSDHDLVPEGADQPSDHAIAFARTVVHQLLQDELVPTKIVASAEGGVAICFVQGDKYADIECLNSGAILGVTTDRRNLPTAWEIHESLGDIAQATARISKFFKGSTARKDVSKNARSRR